MEITVLSILTLLCLSLRPLHILYLMLLLLPIHGTIKEILWGDSGMIFSLWKEIALIIMLAKQWKSKSSLSFSFFHWLTLYVLFLLFYTALGISYNLPVLATLKQLIFPFLIVWCISKMSLSCDNLVTILLWGGIGCILINIIGIIDFLSPSLRMLFRQIMHVGFVLDDQGNVYYDTSSFKIMGIDRACGLMAGGPNQFGVYNAIILFSCMLYWLVLYKVYTYKYKLFFIFITFLSFICLLISFSRAGCAIVVMTLFLYLYRTNSNFTWICIKLVFLGSIIAVLVYLILPIVAGVFIDTFTGKEASSAARADMTKDSLFFVLQNPLGYGIGAVAYTHAGHDFASFAESSILNFGIDLGIGGMLLFVMFVLKIYKMIVVRKSKLALFCACGVMANLITSFVSVNTYENPYIYISWLIFSLPFTFKLNRYEKTME